MAYDTFEDYCFECLCTMSQNSQATHTINIHGATFYTKCYRLPDQATFNSSLLSTVCQGLSAGYTLVLIGRDIVVPSGFTLVPSVPCRGLVIYAFNSLSNSGAISMSLRGIEGSGVNVFLRRNKDNTYEYVPASGAAGTSQPSAYTEGNWWKVSNRIDGNNGVGRQTGSGGAGRATRYGAGTSYGGRGGSGTSFSGGSGGGGCACGGYDRNRWAADGSSLGGSGGYGVVGRGYGGHSSKYATGGSGNPGGIGSYSIEWSSNTTGISDSSLSGNIGTGGLLICYCMNYSGGGWFYSQGASAKCPTRYDHCAGGGASGGGSINIFCGNALWMNCSASGGGRDSYDNGGAYLGGYGGNGTVTKQYWDLSGLRRFLIEKGGQILNYQNSWKIL